MLTWEYAGTYGIVIILYLQYGVSVCDRLVSYRVSDPHSFDPDPDPARIQGCNDQKLKEQREKKKNFWSKTAIYLSLGFHKVCPSYRRSLQLSKEAIQHFKTWTFTNFFLLLWVIFALLDPDPDSESGSTGPIESGSNPDPDPKPWSHMRS